MSLMSTLSSLIESACFHVRRIALACRSRRYRRLAIYDEIRVGNDLVITHQRRDLRFERKVAEFNREYMHMAPTGAVPVSISIRKSNFKEKELLAHPRLLTFFFFRFKETLMVEKGGRKVTVDRTAGLSVYGNLKAALQKGGAEDFYRQTVITLDVPKGEPKSSRQNPSVQENPVPPKVSEPQPAIEPEPIILDPEAVAREHERFVGNVDKIGKAINNGSGDGPVEFEEHETALVQYLRGCEDCRAAKQELQARLTPYRKRLGSVVESINRKSCDMTGEPLIVQDDGDGDYQMIVSYYNIIFSDGR